MRIQRSAILQLVLLFGCDNSVEAVAETPAPKPDALPASALAPEQSAYVAVGRVDLQAVVHGVADGSIKSAAELETKLASEAVANVDLDADGARDELRIVEKRQDKATVFEIRALPTAKAEGAAKADGAVKAEVAAKADANVEIELAPVVAELRLEAQADLGKAVARATFSESFVASAKLTANVNVEHTFTGVKVSGEGLMEVEAEANAFVAWTFRPRRPLFVAEVFVVAHATTPEPDPCWPPGHCKHGFWKATGEDPPGHEKKDGDDKPDHAKRDHDKGKPDKDRPDDKGKPDKAKPDDKGKSDKPSPASDKGKGKPDDKGKSPKPSPASDKGNDKGKGKGK